jgi:hypothetical protein
VAAAQRSAGAAAEAIHEIATVIAEMDSQVGGVAAAASGGPEGHPGLAQLAQVLRGEIVRLTDR